MAFTRFAGGGVKVGVGALVGFVVALGATVGDGEGVEVAPEPAL